MKPQPLKDKVSASVTAAGTGPRAAAASAVGPGSSMGAGAGGSAGVGTGVTDPFSGLFKLFDVGLVLVLIVVVSVVVMSSKGKTRLLENSRQVSLTNQTLLELKATVSGIQDAESGIQSYLLSEDPAFLDLYSNTAKKMNEHLATLEELAPDSPQNQTQLRKLDSLIREKLKQLSQVISFRRSPNYTPEKMEPFITQGAFIMQDIRKVVAEIETNERSLLQDLVENANQVAENSQRTIFLECTFIVVLLLGFRFLMSRQIRAREKTEKESRKISLALSHAIEGIAHIDAGGHYLTINKAYATVFGCKPTELEGQAWFSNIYPDDHAKVVGAYEKMKASGRAEVEARATKKNGAVFYVMLTIVKTSGDLNKFEGFYCFIKDVSREKREHQELIEARKVAMEASLAKSEFLANMSHEIRTPMNGVIGMLGLINKTELTQKQKEYFDTVKVSAEALLTLINDILDLSKIESRKMIFETIDFDFYGMVSDTQRLLIQSARSKGIELTFDISQEVPRYLRGDPGKLRQVLVNLVGNALKFTSEGGVHCVAYAQNEIGNSVGLRVEVRDTGIGISPDALPRLFQPFTQADGSTTRRFGGTGLGLAICKRLIEAMGGEIGAESAEGSGSLFFFTLTFAKGAVPVAEKAAEDKVRLKLEEKVHARVLIVEDNPINQLVTLEMISDLGIGVDTADNGQGALDALRKNSYSLILMDCQMSGMDGYEATKRIRAQEQINGGHIPIVALTADVTSGGKKKCFEAGMDDYVNKPVELEKLSQLVTKWIRAGVNPDSISDASAVASSATSNPRGNSPAQSFDGASRAPLDAVIDWALLQKLEKFHKPGHPSLVKKLTDIYFETAPAQIERIKTLVAQGQLSEMAFEAHALKGASSNLGLIQVAKICFRLEECGKTQTTSPGTAETVRQLEKAYADGKKDLNAWIKEGLKAS